MGEKTKRIGKAIKGRDRTEYYARIYFVETDATGGIIERSFLFTVEIKGGNQWLITKEILLQSAGDVDIVTSKSQAEIKRKLLLLLQPIFLAVIQKVVNIHTLWLVRDIQEKE